MIYLLRLAWHFQCPKYGKIMFAFTNILFRIIVKPVIIDFERILFFNWFDKYNDTGIHLHDESMESDNGIG